MGFWYVLVYSLHGLDIQCLDLKRNRQKEKTYQNTSMRNPTGVVHPAALSKRRGHFPKPFPMPNSFAHVDVAKKMPLCSHWRLAKYDGETRRREYARIGSRRRSVRVARTQGFVRNRTGDSLLEKTNFISKEDVRKRERKIVIGRQGFLYLRKGQKRTLF